jgi:hypothetical protein
MLSYNVSQVSKNMCILSKQNIHKPQNLIVLKSLLVVICNLVELLLLTYCCVMVSVWVKQERECQGQGSCQGSYWFQEYHIILQEEVISPSPSVYLLPQSVSVCLSVPYCLVTHVNCGLALVQGRVNK